MTIVTEGPIDMIPRRTGRTVGGGKRRWNAAAPAKISDILQEAERNRIASRSRKGYRAPDRFRADAPLTVSKDSFAVLLFRGELTWPAPDSCILVARADRVIEIAHVQCLRARRRQNESDSSS